MSSPLTKYRWFAIPLALGVVVLLIVPFMGSAQKHDPSNGTSTPPSLSQSLLTQHVSPYRSYRLYDLWFDRSSPSFDQSKQMIADWLDAACLVPNSAGFDADIGFLSANSFAPSGFSIHCPAISKPPVYPTLTPTPVSCGDNPYDTSCQDSVDEGNGTPLAWYTATVAAFNNSVMAAKQEVSQGTEKLRRLEPTTSNRSAIDVYGAVKRSSYRFENTPPGSHFLVFVGSSLINTTQINSTDTSPFYGAKVLLLWWSCNQVRSCADAIAYWFSYFRQNGCHGDPLRYDADRSVTLPNPFL